MTIPRRMLSMCATALSLGCFAYVPADLETVPVGSRVRAMLSSEGQVDFRNRTAMDLRVINGTLVEKSRNTVLLSVSTGTTTLDAGFPTTLHQLIDVPRQDIARVDRRKLDELKTGVLIGAVAGAVTTVAILALRGGEPGTLTVPPNEPPESVRGWLRGVSVFRW